MRIIILLFLMPLMVHAQVTREDFYSTNTGDTYEIIIKTPKGFDSSVACHLVFFTDASLKSGKTIFSQSETTWKHCVLIGIAHKGDWHSKRRRDFIPSDITGNSSKDFGQAARFFAFMKEELMPRIDKQFKNQKTKIFIGHSLGGAIALYLSLRENDLFDHYYAISPSVWVNYRELLKLEKRYSVSNEQYNSTISIYAGSLEVFNKVLNSSKEFYNAVKGRNYRGLTISHTVVNGVNHYGIIAKVIPVIFQQLN